MLHRPGPTTLLCLVCALAALAAQAGQADPSRPAGPARINRPLADPTRPPGAAAPAGGPALAQRGAGFGALARAAAPATPVAATPPLPSLPPLPLLQGVQVPARGPAVAMIDGQTVKAGDQVAGRLVVAIDPQGLLLRGPGGDERLWLLGGSPKQAPGSLQTSQSARYVPAPAAAEPAPDAAPETAPPSRTELASRGMRASALPAANATTGPLSLAGKNAP